MSGRTVRGAAALLVMLISQMPAPVLAQKPAPVEYVSSLPHRTPAEERKALHVPPGFEVQLVAAEPDIQKPLNLAFDDRGRLWVTDTVEYPYPAQEGTRPRDTVKVLADFAPDGKARSITTFADGLNIPIGVLPLPSARAALVHSIPHILLLKDDDGDGKADSREVLYGIFGHRDTHGMTNAFTWGFDGWVYACHGFSNDSKVQGKDGKPIAMNSGNTYRMRPDGSHAEYVTHGQVNPFGLAFDPLGNLYSCDCHSRPVYQLLPGAWYPSFGKPHDGLGFGPEMVDHDHGSTGIAGISYYAAEQFPAAYRGTVFIGNVVTNRINHDRIEWRGSTPKGIEQPDFVWSEDNWFRPVDIELGPDGALYVADFYNRIIGHYEVPLTHPGRDRTSGRIWRIIYRGTDGKLPPPPLPGTVDRTTSPVAALTNDLSDPNLAVRIAAANQLVERGGNEALVAMRSLLTSSAGAVAKAHALWVLQRRGVLDDQSIFSWYKDATDRTLRVHLLRILRERPQIDGGSRSIVLKDLAAQDPFVRRAAALALGTHPDFSHVKPLLALRQSVSADDTHLLHVARMALRDQLRGTGVWGRLDGLGLSERDRRDLADVAVGVPSAEAADYLLAHIRSLPESHENLLRYVHHIARHGAREARSRLLSVVLAGDRPTIERLALLQASQRGAQERGEPLDEEVRKHAEELCRKLLGSRTDHEVGLGIHAASEMALASLVPELRKVFQRNDLTQARRGEAMRTIAAIDPGQGVSLLRGMLLNSSASVEVRETAAIALANLDRPEAQGAVLEALPTAPGPLQSTIAAALARRRDGADSLLKSIEAGKGSPRLLQERRVMIGLENAAIPHLQQRVAGLLKGLPPADQKLKELLRERKSGYPRSARDPARGALVFEKNCGICHQMEGKGAKVGPQLDGIGSRGIDRLLEDVLDPNRNVDQNFRVTNLALDTGQVVSGLLLREEGEVLIVADAQGKEVRVSRKSVEERTTAQLSPMPANMAEQIPEAEFQDLMAYLLSRAENTKPVPAGTK